MKIKSSKYQFNSLLKVLKKTNLSVVEVLWHGRKYIPVLIAGNRTVQAAKFGDGPQPTFEGDVRGHTILHIKQGAKALAVAAAMPLCERCRRKYGWYYKSQSDS